MTGSHQSPGLTGSTGPLDLAPCPVCGALSVDGERQVSALLAVCDVLVFKALEAVGKWIVRSDRSRFKALGSSPFYLAHTAWPVSYIEEDVVLGKALRGAWDAVPALLGSHGVGGVTAGQVTDMLNQYVHDLVVTGQPHRLATLAEQFTDKLRLPVRLADPAQLQNYLPRLEEVPDYEVE